MKFGAVKGIVFDLDGTLVDSAPDIADSLNQFLARRSVEPFDLHTVRTMIGGGVPKLLERAWRARGREKINGLTVQVKEFIQIYGARPTLKSAPYPGASDTLRRLHEAGFVLGLCTNKPEAITLQMIEGYHWARYFTTIIGGDTTSAKKPDPTPMAAALDRMALSTEDALVIGDSHADIDAARALGMRCMLVTYGYSRKPVSDYNPDACIDDLSEAVELLLPAAASA